MTYANPIQRQDLISGLRALSDFLESNPEIPVPPSADVLVFPPSVSDAEKREEIDIIAAQISASAKESNGHYLTSRQFGPVGYRAVAIPADQLREQ